MSLPIGVMSRTTHVRSFFEQVQSTKRLKNEMKMISNRSKDFGVKSQTKSWHHEQNHSSSDNDERNISTVISAKKRVRLGPYFSPTGAYWPASPTVHE